MKDLKLRSILVDVLRGISVIAVLMAHSIQRGLYPSNYLDNYLVQLILPWYMTLFMLLSGYTLGLTIEQVTLKQKFYHLIYPTFIWSIILFLIHNFEVVGIKWYFDFDAYNLLTYCIMLLIKPTYVIWFLYTVFAFTLIVWLVHKMVGKMKIKMPILAKILELLFLCGIFLLLSLNKNKEYFGLYQISKYWVYFLMGYSIILFEVKIEDIWKPVSIVTCILLILRVFLNICIINPVWNVIDACLGMGIIYLLGTFVVRYKDKRIVKQITLGLSWFGKNSLTIYLFQTALLNLGIGTGALRIVTIFISATAFSILMTLLVKKYKALSAIILGDFIK